VRLGGREARAFLARPDPRILAALVTGEDGARVADARAGLLGAIVGPEGEAEMRLGRMAGAEVRRDPAMLLDALKAQGFFPGPRAVLLEDATDGLAPVLAAALDALGPGDARLVATGAGLPARGALRRLFEGRAGVVAITLYDDPPTPADLDAMLAGAGLSAVARDARDELLARAQGMEPGEVRGLVELLALHQQGEDGPLEARTVAALAPDEGGDLDDLVLAVSEGRREAVAPLVARLAARGVSPVEVAIRLGRIARQVLAVASDPGGVEAGLQALRPPLGGPRRQAVARAATAWGPGRSAEALREMVSLDLRLRSGGAAPGRALVEAAVLRLARPGRGG
jgi:DNA polymerase-3 subunit delta